MSTLNKVLDHHQLNTLELLLGGAFAPLEGYLNQNDHISVLQRGRLANGFLWPLPLSLALTPAEKLEAQITGRIALLDEETRTIAQIRVEQLYRLPAAIARLNGSNPDNWYVAGKVEPLGKVLHPAFNRIRHAVPSLRSSLQENGWKSVVAVSASPQLNMADMLQACEWLHASQSGEGGMLVQISADERDSAFHQQIRELRSSIRCSAARQIKLSLLPSLPELSPERTLLLHALVARNYGATGFVVGLETNRTSLRYLLQHRDELGLDIIPVRHATKNKINQALAQGNIQPTHYLENTFRQAA